MTQIAQEKIFIKPLFLYPLKPMSETESNVLLSLLMATKNGDIAELTDQVKDEQSYRMLSLRSEWAGFEVDPAATLLACTLSTTPAELVMYLHAMYHSPSRKEGEPFTLDKFCETFPLGFPDEKAKHLAWIAQKVSKGNGSTFNALDSIDMFKATERNPTLYMKTSST